MAFPLQLDQASYETLVELARQGVLNSDGSVNQDKSLALESWLQQLEQANDVHRYFLWVQWQEQGAPLPASTRFPKEWPPSLRAYVSLVSRQITRSDIDALLATRAKSPTNVLVTKDPAAIVGWMTLEAYFK